MKVKRESNNRKIFTSLRRQLRGTISSGLNAGHNEMLRRVPVDDGDLESTCKKHDDGLGFGYLAAGGPSEVSDEFVDYAEHIEFGTTKMAAQPFFRPAVDAATQTINSGMRNIK